MGENPVDLSYNAAVSPEAEIPCRRRCAMLMTAGQYDLDARCGIPEEREEGETIAGSGIPSGHRSFPEDRL